MLSKSVAADDKGVEEVALPAEWRSEVLINCQKHVDNREPRVRNLGNIYYLTQANPFIIMIVFQ